MHFLRELPSVEEIVAKYPLTAVEITKRQQKLSEIQSILSGKDNRKLLLAGPCSADREDAVIDYVLRLAKLQEEVAEKFLIIPRVYTGKPRSKTSGYKGMLHRPSSSDSEDDLLAGVEATRQIHLNVIRQTGMFSVDEMLYPESISYILDLLVYVAVGARSVEDQGHRLMASGLEVPVGMKNPSGGDLYALLDSVTGAQHRQSMIFRGWEIATDGNPYAHAILRGYTDINGTARPNYHYEDLLRFHDMYIKSNLKNTSVIIDCNHANSNKCYDEQSRITKEIIGYCAKYTALNQFIKGIMIESYLEDGAQLPGGGVYGKSVTDACLGWDKTRKLVMEVF